MVIKLMLPPPPPLNPDIHLKCIQGYCETLIPHLTSMMFNSVTAMGLAPLNPCTAAGLYVLTSELREIARREALKEGLSNEDLETAVKHAWPEFVLDLEHQEAGADQRADRSKN